MNLNFSAFLEGFSTFFVGVGMVFVALLLLILLIKVVGKIVGSIENKNKPEAMVEVPTEVTIVEECQAVPNQDELEIVAVITDRKSVV